MMGEKDIIGMGSTIVLSGQGTTPNVMDIILGLLVNHQDIQETAYNHIQMAIGDRNPTHDDRVKLPYIEVMCPM